MARPLENTVALVTGGGRGIGAGICAELVQQGARVMVSDVNDGEPTPTTMGDLAKAGGEVEFFRADAGKVQDVQAAVEATVRTFECIDLLVNNAGAARAEEPDTITEEAWDHHLNLHLKGPFFAAQAAGNICVGKGTGR